MTDQEKNIYTPSEAAGVLGISVTMLRYMRLTGRIEGTSLGNTTVYTAEQLRNADLTNRKPGPKVKKETVEGESEDEGGRSSSVMLKDSGRLLLSKAS